MKQLPGSIRNRLTNRSTFNDSISRADISEVVEAEDTDEDGRPGNPGYFAALRNPDDEPGETRDNGSPQEGKGEQIDFEI